MNNYQKAIKAIREAKATGMGKDLVWQILADNPSVFEKAWDKIAGIKKEKPIVPPALVKGTPFSFNSIYRCLGCGKIIDVVGINRMCRKCDPESFNKEVIG